jgi:hypothetical protein
MNHYFIPQSTKSEKVLSTMSLYKSLYPKVHWPEQRCCNIRLSNYTIQIEKYSMMIQVWHRKTKKKLWRLASTLGHQKDDYKIVLCYNGNPTFHDYIVSWSHLRFVDLFSEASEIEVPLADGYSYRLRSNLEGTLDGVEITEI